MLSKFRQRCFEFLIFIALGLSISLLININQISQVKASGISVNKVALETKNPLVLEQQGQDYYDLAQFEQAIEIWQQTNQIYRDSQDILGQGRVLSNLALAYSHLNNWQQATQNITQSWDLLNQDSDLAPKIKIPVLAQVLNNQGILELNQGKAEQAIATWERAKVNYRLVADELGIIRASINQASAYKELGFYQRAVTTLAKVEANLMQQPNSLIKATGLRSYGDILRLVGQVKKAQDILKASLTVVSSLDNPNEEIKTLIALGNTYKSSEPKQFLKIYAQGLKKCHQDFNCLASNLPLKLNLAMANLLLDTPQWQDSQKLIASIQNEFIRLPLSRTNIEQKINFAHILIKLNHQYADKQHQKIKIPPFLAVDQFLQEIIQQAQSIDYLKAQSYSWGLRGKIQEELQNWQQAQKYTQQALILSQRINAPEIIYLWQWQLGRIHRALGKKDQAIADYSQAVELLKSLSTDLAAIDPDVQYSFREGVEPVYRELVSLLLTRDHQTVIKQANLENARKVIESLHLAELNNFFREACLENQTVEIDNVDHQAAIIYPIILENRLEVILSLPNQPLKHYTANITQAKLDKIIKQFRQSIVVRSRRYYYYPAKQLYELLISPALADLTENEIKTLVFVPDGSLRNIPLGALYDGNQYLIENYNVALTPGLQLLAPRPIKQTELKTIAVGLTKGTQGFAPLDYVDSELNKIKETISSLILVNENFTSQTLQQEIKYSNYPIIHIATHGKFSSAIEDTFLLAWDDKLSINQLDSILQTRNLNQKNVIELLVLSACETATGDRRAALGLAGMAVRAGARSTLATLWSVNDRATSKLMSDFYQELSQQHLTKADAVRQAQLSLLHSQGYEHPFYWAPSVLLGNWL